MAVPPDARAAGVQSGSHLCTSCGSQMYPKLFTKGSGRIELILWLCFLVPGLIYSTWRFTTKGFVCRAPADSPPSFRPTHRWQRPRWRKCASGYRSLPRSRFARYRCHFRPPALCSKLIEQSAPGDAPPDGEPQDGGGSGRGPGRAPFNPRVGVPPHVPARAVRTPARLGLQPDVGEPLEARQFVSGRDSPPGVRTLDDDAIHIEGAGPCALVPGSASNGFAGAVQTCRHSSHR